MTKIMVVDDDEKVRKLLKHFLEVKGYQVITVSGGEEALEKLKEEPEIVLLDIMMPGMDGREVLDKIKEISPSTDVIMVTALVEHDVGVETMGKGAFDYVTKPIDLKHLEELISFKVMQRSLAKEA